MILWWTRIFNENVDLIFTAMNAHEILDYDGPKFLTSIRVWFYSSECLWNYRTSSFTMTCYDLAKEDQLDADMMILIFRTFNAPERLFVNL